MALVNASVEVECSVGPRKGGENIVRLKEAAIGK